MIRIFAGIALLLAPVAVPAADRTPIAIDAPELAPRGALPVGTRSLSLTSPNRPDLLKPDGSGGFMRGGRILPIEIWYPATADATGSQHTRYAMPPPPIAGAVDPKMPATIEFDGIAARDAAPAKGPFPLVVLSHGFGNRAVSWSDLAENIASKGYVVVAIEHGDLDAKAAGSRPASFLVTLANRAADQRFVIDTVTAAKRDPAFAAIDPARVALIGYSMGGYGALATAGAGYDPASPIISQVPKGLLDGYLEDQPKPPANLKAIVAFGPWGGAPATRVWTARSLGAITIPSLIIDGDHDDIADFPTGVHWLFDEMAGSDRRLLVYREARHNIAMNETPPALIGQFGYIDRFNEPVWRKDRILAINAHMITAFLDWKLKGMAERQTYLDPPTPIAADGKWPGFQPRWGLGLELHHDQQR